MKKLSSDILDNIVDRVIVQSNLDQYGDLESKIKQAAIEDLAQRGIHVDHTQGDR